MKLSFLLLAFSTLLVVSCSNKEGGDTSEKVDSTTTASSQLVKEQAAPELTSIEFLESSHDFGTINEGEKVVHMFKFKNIGNNPLILSDARASCGCTIPSFTKEAVAPGEEGELKVEYDSKGKEGQITKTVTVTANTEPKTTDVKIMVNVRKKIEGPFNK